MPNPTLYDDIYIRKSLSDQGLVPADASAGYCNSPDIVPTGTQPLSDVSVLKDNWNKDIGKDIVKNGQNYIYLRGKNLAAGAESGNFSLYYTPASLIMYPFKWLENRLETSGGSTTSAVAAEASGEIVYTKDPFTWITGGPAAGDHFCLVGMVETPQHAAPVPSVKDMKDMAQWLLNNPNVAWRNVAVVDQGIDFAMPVEYDQGAQGGVMYVFLDCTELPVGAEISFGSGTPLGDGSYVALDWTTVPRVPNNPGATVNPSFTAGAKFNIGAGWDSTITYNYRSNGHVPGDNFKIELKVAFYQEGGAQLQALLPLADESAHAQRHAREVHALLSYAAHPAAAIGPGKFIGIGSHRTLMKR